MDSTANTSQLLQYISQPAFLVKNGLITDVNNAASMLQLKPGTAIASLIRIGTADYESFTSGKLYLELTCGRAWVVACSDAHLFYVEQTYSSPELRAFALAAQALRQPLSDAITGTELLLADSAIEKNAGQKDRLSQINRNLYQLVRAICNMSDASQLGIACNAKPQLQNAASFFDEIFQKASELTRETGRSLSFQGLRSSIDCIFDRQILERAVLNLISNAIKFSPADSTVRARLKQTGHMLTLTVENRIADSNSPIYANAFHRFLREPGIESGQAGIGLGMAIISAAASAHDGTILISLSNNETAKIAFSFPINRDAQPIVRSPLVLLEGYTGGIDNYLIELSDILPNSLY